MADEKPPDKPAEKPKGLDLGRLLKKSQPPAVASPSTVGPETLPLPPAAASPPPASKPGLDLGKLLAKAKRQAEPAAPAPPRRAVAEKPRPLAVPLEANARIEQQASVKGAKQERLNVVQREPRRYPLGSLGGDELFLYALTHLNVARSNLQHAKTRGYDRFALGLRIIGALRRDYGLYCDGHDVHGVWDKLPDKPDAIVTVDSDVAIDVIRGRLACIHAEFDSQTQIEGDLDLLRALRLKRHPYENEELMADALSVPRDNGLGGLRREARDAIDVFIRAFEARVERLVKWLDEPTVARAKFFEQQPAVEVLFHFENKKLTVLRGKPGEVLVEGKLELLVPRKALEALWDGECSLLSALGTGLIGLEGELLVARRIGLCPPETLRMIRFVQEHHGLPTPGNPLLVPLPLPTDESRA